MPAVYTVRGQSELVSNLNTIPIKLGTQKNIIARNLRKAGAPVAIAAERHAPVLNEPERIQRRRGRAYRLVAGQLKRSQIVVVSEQTATGAVVRVGPSTMGFYGAMEERGTFRQRARPWLRPAFDESVNEALSILAAGIGEDIEREMARL